MSTIQLGLSFMLYSIAIKSVTALDSALIVSIEPLLNPLWVFLVVGEAPGMWALLGGCIVLAAVTGRNLVVARRSAAVYRAPVKPYT